MCLGGQEILKWFTLVFPSKPPQRLIAITQNTGLRIRKKITRLWVRTGAGGGVELCSESVL